MEAVLPPQPTSARRGRHLAVEALRRQQRDELVDEVSLLVSEIVTNAVLHAGSDIYLRVVVDARVVRVEVQDASSVVPAAHDATEEETTGRGLAMVELLASRWGVEQRLDGKVVWFEIGEPRGPEVEEAPPAPQPQQEPGGPPGRRVTLVGTPVRLCRAVQRHNDALLREYALRAFAEEATATVSDHLGLMAALHVQLESDLTVGDPVRTIVLTAPTTDREAIAGLLATLDRADELAQTGQLLTPPALPEVAACRLWLFRQVAAQLEGDEPTPWSTTGDDEAGGESLDTVVDTTIIEQLTEGVVVADATNRIAYVNQAAEQLFGWERGALVGRRLTTLVPERLRDAHIAGFTRFLLTRDPHLIGAPVRVPGRRRDGSEVAIELMLSAIRRNSGRELFVGTVRPDGETGEQILQAADIEALQGGVRRVVADLVARPPATAAEAAERVLPVVGAALGYSVGALWQPEHGDGVLRCLSVWEAAEGRYPAFVAITRRHRFAPGIGLPGRVWQSGLPAWIPDLVADANFPRLGTAVEEGLRSGFAFPVIDEEGVSGIFEFFIDEPRPLRPTLLGAAAVVGHLVAAVLARPAGY